MRVDFRAAGSNARIASRCGLDAARNQNYARVDFDSCPSLRLARSQPLRGIQGNPHVRRVFLCLRRKWAEGETNAGRAESGRVVLMQRLMARGARLMTAMRGCPGGRREHAAREHQRSRQTGNHTQQAREVKSMQSGRAECGGVASMQRLTARGEFSTI